MLAGKELPHRLHTQHKDLGPYCASKTVREHKPKQVWVLLVSWSHSEAQGSLISCVGDYLLVWKRVGDRKGDENLDPSSCAATSGVYYHSSLRDALLTSFLVLTLYLVQEPMHTLDCKNICVDRSTNMCKELDEDIHAEMWWETVTKWLRVPLHSET